MTPLDTMHTTFTRWLGQDYDLDAIDAVVAAAAVIQLDGDPLWLLLVGGPGNAKTETVSALRNSATILSSISSEAALLSATGAKDRDKDATGGLLAEVGESGVLVVKDFTSILEMPHKTRGSVLAALREVYDGQWSRQVGEGGGRRLEWVGRVALVGAVTTAWDTHQAVVSEMGDRFVVLRLNSETNRLAGGRQAIANTGHETTMRAELAQAVTTVLATVDTAPVLLTPDECEGLLQAADLVTRARTAVDHDRNGNATFAHAPEMPTRYARQLTQLVRGAPAIGLSREEAIGLARRCARDSVPPLRLEVLVFLADNPASLVADCARALDKPRNTIDRALQDLHLIGLVSATEATQAETYIDSRGGSRTRQRTLLRYSLRDGVTTASLFPAIELHPLPPYRGGSESGNNSAGSGSEFGNNAQAEDDNDPDMCQACGTEPASTGQLYCGWCSPVSETPYRTDDSSNIAVESK